jgi:methyltransferase family protein
MPTTPIHDLPFDAYQRYQLVADLVRRFPSFGPETSVLDVGGRTALMRGFLPELRVDLVDVEPADEAGLVIGSGGALPFRDGAFDIVTACDTLEHVPAEHRDAFVRECARVSKGWVVLAGPYASDEVREAESELREFLKQKLDLDHRYLNEHFEHGLPCRDRTAAEFRAAGCEVDSVGHASLARWLPLMCLEMYMDSDPHLREVAKRYFRVYNQALYASDHAGPVYRHAVIAAKAGVALPQVDGLFEAPVAPPRTLEVFDELVGELVAFDRERDVYQAERDRLREVNDGLHADLLGHAESLATVRADLASHKGTLAEVRADLEAHRTILQARTDEYEAEREARQALESELEVHRRHAAELQLHVRKLKDVNQDLESDLTGNRETVAALRAELDGFRAEHTHALTLVQADLAAHRDVLGAHEAELDARAVVIGELQAQLTDHRAEKARLETELAEATRSLDALQAATDEEVRALRQDLEFERERNAALTQDLADRWKNLRRAIEPRRHA